MSAGCRSNREATARGPRKRTRGVRALLLGLVAVVAMAIGVPTASAAPFTCDAFGYLYQTNGVSPTHSVIQIDLATGAYNPNYAFTPGYTNAVGYNVRDNFMYGMQIDQVGVVGAITLVRIHSDGHVDDLGLPAGMPPLGGGIVTGDVDANGHYWVLDQTPAPDHWYEIDVVPGSPTYGDVIAQGDITQPTTFLSPSDWVYINGRFWGLPDANPGGSGNTHLVSWTPGAPTYTDHGVTNIADGSGAVYTDAAGYLYASINATGDVYRVDVNTRQTVLVSHATSSSGNDGARCARAVIPTITVTKTVAGRVRSSDQFTVGLLEDTGRHLTSATTSGNATSASTTNFPVSQGHTYTITDAMAAGSGSPLSEYVQSIVCKDDAGNSVATGGSAGSWTLKVSNASYYTCNVTNKAEADLEIDKSASPIPAVPGTNGTYSLKVTNHGPSTAINVKVSDPLPSGLTFVSASSGCAHTNGTVTCSLPSLAAGGSKTFTVTTKIDSGADTCSDLRNTATVTNDVADNDLTNNSSSYCPPTKGQSDLSLDKTVSQTQVGPGGQVMYTLVVHNDGPSDDKSVKVVDPLAQGLSLVSAQPSQGSCSTANGQVSCDLGTLKADGSAQILVTTNVTAHDGCITNVATVSGSRSDPNPDNSKDSDKTCVQPPPDPRFDLAVTKKADDKSVYVGEPVKYTITVTNKGPGAAQSVDVTDTLNWPASVVSVKASQGSCNKDIPMSCQLGTIKAGGKVTITVVVKLRDDGCKQRNAASATADGTDTNPANNVARVDVCAKAVPLRLTKVADRGSIRAGDTIGYTIRVSNRTDGEAKEVKVCDKLPSGLVYVSSRAKAKFTGGQYCWTIATLGAHKGKRYRITVRALGGASGGEVNRASASAKGARTKRASDPIQVLPARASGGGVTG
jgi:uncharacterized repeat protein (TIGR01451 family)